MATSIGFDIVAHDRASRTLDNVGRSADRSGSKWKTLGKAVKFAALGIAGGIGLAGAAAVKFARGAAEDEQAAGRLAVAMRKNAGATKSQVAATEDWISKQGVALGVTDDELRPALGRLVTSTHDVGKAQRLAGLAMDVSAGTGKSLETVSTALMKANNGQVSSLARLGINTKNAAGETISMERATRRMAATFGGQAAKAADSTQGKFDRLKLVLSETGETIGYKLLPPLTTAATWFLSKGVPALSRFSSQFQSVLVPSLRSTGSFITGSVIPAVSAMVPVLLRVASAAGSTVGFFARHRTTLAALLGTIAAVVAITKVHTAVMAVQAAGGLLPMLKGLKLVAAATRAYAAVQWVLNAALSANPIGIAVLALAALGVALAIAWRKSDTFRAVVTGAFNGIRKVVTSVVSNVVGFVRNNWRLLIAIIAGPLGIAVGLVTKHWGSIRSATIGAWNAVRSAVSGAIRGAVGIVRSNVAVARAVVTGAWNAVRSSTSAIWNGIKSVISNSVAGWMSIINGIRGRVTGAFAGAGGWLLSAGRAIIGGLIDGVQAMIRPLTSALGAITKLIPKKKGPIDKDRKLLKPAGEALIEGLIAGITKKWISAERILKALTGRIKATGDKVKSLMGARSEFAKGFGGFSGSMFGLDLSGTSGDADAMVNYQQTELEKARQLRVDVARLTKAKLSGGLLKQLQASGEGGIAQIHALAQGTDQQIRLAGSLHAQTQRELGRTGANAAQALYGDDIKAGQRESRLARKIGEAVRRELHGRDADEVVFRLRGDELVGVLKRTKRVRGNKPLGIS